MNTIAHKINQIRNAIDAAELSGKADDFVNARRRLTELVWLLERQEMEREPDRFLAPDEFDMPREQLLE